jgi:sec-independent protein translocase protein TatB
VFNLQGSELVIILLLALVVLGPEKLPEAMRKLGEFYGQLKKMSSGFQQEFRAATQEPVREIKETANVLRDSVDFRKLATGEREEKPKSAEMAPAEPPLVAPADPASVPTDDVPFGPDHPVDVAPEPPVEPAPVVPPVEQPVGQSVDVAPEAPVEATTDAAHDGEASDERNEGP